MTTLAPVASPSRLEGEVMWLLLVCSVHAGCSNILLPRQRTTWTSMETTSWLWLVCLKRLNQHADGFQWADSQGADDGPGQQAWAVVDESQKRPQSCATVSCKPGFKHTSIGLVGDVLDTPTRLNCKHT